MFTAKKNRLGNNRNVVKDDSVVNHKPQMDLLRIINETEKVLKHHIILINKQNNVPDNHKNQWSKQRN